MKKNRLYTLNKWNQPVFMQDRLFPEGGTLAGFDRAASAEYGAKYGDEGFTLNDYMNSKNAFGISKADNPFSKGNLAGGLGAMVKTPIGGALIGGLASTVGKIGGGLIGGGLESGVGNAIGNIGGTIGSAISSVNPIVGGIVSVGSGIIGGGVNRLFGEKVDTERLNQANADISSLSNFKSNAGSFDDIQGPAAVANVGGIYKGGIWNSSAERKQKALEEKMLAARQFADRSITNNSGNLVSDQLSDSLYNYAALGGPIEIGDSTGAIGYDFMDRYLTAKERQAAKGRQTGINQVPAFMPNSFAIGGDLQTNGGDFSSGLTRINAGQSHELNPNEGVQLGTDPEGVPNLVEEGETVFNDYVYSNRIKCDDATKQLFHISKKRDITYADLSKRLEKEIAERPSDPISKAGFEKQMQMLEEQQERQKAEMEAEKAKAAFNALSPEEQMALMQQRAEQEAMAQQQAMAEQQAAIQQPTPEEIDMVQQQIQQMQQADGSNAVLGQEPQTMAEGGNLYSGEQKGSSKMRNAGTWKKGTSAENWNAYTRNGLRDYLSNIVQRINMAPDDKTKNEIRQEAIKTVGDIQQAYAKAYQKDITPSEKNEAVKTLQTLFQNARGNAYFDKIADNINLPVGHNTSDTAEQGWVDGFWGPRTSIRNWGSTEYGDADSYRDLSDLAAQAGLVYAPNEAWRYGDNTLYGLSMPASQEVPVEESPSWTPEWQNGQTQAPASSSTPATPGPATAQAPAEKNTGVSPRHKAGWLRYAGLFGPAIGLGLQAAGIGRPDTAGIDASLRGAGDVSLARWKPIGNYLTYRPLDIWYQQNALNAQSRATDRNLMNTSGSNRGAVAAGLLANGYNSQIASGNLFRQAQEYNDSLRKQVEDFNRGTNQYNSEQYGITSRFNADARNRARQANAQLRLHAAAQKADMDAGWNQGIYGNIAGLFKGLGDIGRENEQFNWLSDLAADGAFGNLGTSNTGRRWTKEKKSKGGKIKKRGLTI